jgi:hypothetical protein
MLKSSTFYTWIWRTAELSFGLRPKPSCKGKAMESGCLSPAQEEVRPLKFGSLTKCVNNSFLQMGADHKWEIKYGEGEISYSCNWIVNASGLIFKYVVGFLLWIEIKWS